MHLHVKKWYGPLDLVPSEVETISNNITGVYVIWSEEKKQVIYVGSGNIQECLLRHIQKADDPVVQAKLPNLKASFIVIPDEKDYQGAENYLAYLYNPEKGTDYPNEVPREVEPYPLGKPFLKRTPYAYSPDAVINRMFWLIYEPAFREWACDKHGGYMRYAHPVMDEI